MQLSGFPGNKTLDKLEAFASNTNIPNHSPAGDGCIGCVRTMHSIDKPIVYRVGRWDWMEISSFLPLASDGGGGGICVPDGDGVDVVHRTRSNLVRSGWAASDRMAVFVYAVYAFSFPPKAMGCYLLVHIMEQE